MPAQGDDPLEPPRLADYTTIRLGGPARGFVRAGTEEELIEAVRAADASGEPVLILGGGSNLVVSDEGFDGTVIQVATRGVSRDAGPGGLTVAAGEDWDALVARTVAEGLAGLECLSGIPGLAGATPIQNVGAYGQEVSQTITRVRVYDRQAGAILDIPAGQCGFGYRTSRFRGADRFVVLSVTFLLGLGFVAMEISEFHGMAVAGAGPWRSGFFSAFFTLVGCHGLHVSIGLLWLVVMMAQVAARGYRATVVRRLFCFSMFWHTLDIIWVGIFSVVYLMGSLA